MAVRINAKDVLRALSLVGTGAMLASGPAPVGRAANVLAMMTSEGVIGRDKFAGRNAAGPGMTPGDIAAIKARDGASSYPREFYPDQSGHTVGVTLVGNGVHNSQLDMGLARQAGRMQTLDEHNGALFGHVRPGMNAAELHAALAMGRDDERKLPQFWADSKPRENYHPSSSAVRAVRITPDGNIEVQWNGKNPRWYTFRQYPNTYEASLAMNELMTSDSLGRAVMPTQRHGKPINFKDPNIGWWNRQNYDSSFAK